MSAGILYIGDAGDLDAGVVVDRETAIEIASVFACIHALTEDVGQVPLPVYVHTQEGRVKAWREPVYKAFKYGPNAWQTLQDWQEQIMLHALTHGDYFARIGRVAGEFRELYPVENPEAVRPYIKNGRRFFEMGKRTYDDTEMLHIHGASIDGYAGRDMCDTHRQTLAMAKALYRYGAKFFANGGQLRGILILPPGSKSEDAKAAVTTFEEKYGGENAFKIAAYANATDFKPIVADPEKAQALGSREQVNKEIAALYRIPLWRLYGEQPPTLEARVAYYTDAVRPWLVRIAGAVNKYLIGSDKPLYAEHNTAALLQSDIKTRFEAYAVGITNRFINPNEVRQRENMTTYPGGAEFVNPNVMSAEDTKRIEADKATDKGTKTDEK